MLTRSYLKYAYTGPTQPGIRQHEASGLAQKKNFTRGVEYGKRCMELTEQINATTSIIAVSAVCCGHRLLIRVYAGPRGQSQCRQLYWYHYCSGGCFFSPTGSHGIISPFISLRVCFPQAADFYLAFALQFTWYYIEVWAGSGLWNAASSIHRPHSKWMLYPPGFICICKYGPSRWASVMVSPFPLSVVEALYYYLDYYYWTARNAGPLSQKIWRGK